MASVLQYAVQLTSSSTETSSSYALVNGVFRWVTGQPGYPKTPSPTYESGITNSHTWFEGWLLQDSIGTPSRRVDITVSGDYGTLSGFSFSIKNNRQLDAFLTTNDIYLMNRPIILYAVFDDVFYTIWTGVVGEISQTETEYEFTCIDSFKTLHKPLPPVVINEANYPGADREAIGETIPVVFGDVPYAKAVKIQNTKEFIELNRTVYGSAGISYDIAPGMSYYQSYETGTGKIIPGVSIIRQNTAPGNLAGKYLVAVAGENANTGKYIRIDKSEYGQDIYFTDGKKPTELITLSEPLDRCDPTTFNAYYKYSAGYYARPETWWFKVCDFGVELTAGSGTGISFYRDSNNNIPLYRFNEGTGAYEDAKSILAAIGASGSNKASLSLYATSLTDSGDMESVAPIEFNAYTRGPALQDMNRSTYDDVQGVTGITISTTWTPTLGWIEANNEYTFPLTFPDTKQLADYNAVYMCMDHQWQRTPGDSTQFQFKYGYRVRDIYNNFIWLPQGTEDVQRYESDVFPTATEYYTATETGINVNHIPNDYYKTGLTNGEYSEFGVIDREGTEFITRGDKCKLPDEIKTLLETGAAVELNLSVFTKSRSGTVHNVRHRIKQIGVFGYKTVPTTESTLYTHISGEKLYGLACDNVYMAFKLMLEGYDKIPADQIDYDNLSQSRNTWRVSRQVTSQMSSAEYIKDLAQHSFVAVFPTRSGKRKLRSWRDVSLVSATHDSSVIVRGSIKEFNKTSPALLYNEMKVQFAYSYALGKFERALTVTKVDQTTFPGSSDLEADGTYSFGTYVGGVNPSGAYGDSKIIWESCKNGYLRSAMLNPLPQQIGDCYWYTDPKIIPAQVSRSVGARKAYKASGSDTSSGAWYFLKNLAEWVTRQKDLITYEIPLTTDNLQLELCDRVTVNDVVYTAGVDRTGWITQIDVKPKTNTIKLTVLLNPPELESGEDTDNLIIESGSRDDTVVETGSRDDTFVEGEQI